MTRLGQWNVERGMRQHYCLHVHSHPEWIRSHLTKQMEKSGTSGHTCRAAEGPQQTGGKCMMYVQLSLTTLTDTSARKTAEIDYYQFNSMVENWSCHAMNQTGCVTTPCEGT